MKFDSWGTIYIKYLFIFLYLICYVLFLKLFLFSYLSKLFNFIIMQ